MSGSDVYYDWCNWCGEKFEEGPSICPFCDRRIHDQWWKGAIALGVLVAFGIGIGVAAFAVWRCMT